VKEVMKTTDHVDILFANAGATWGEAFDTHPDSAFAKVMDLNVKSVFNTTSGSPNSLRTGQKHRNTKIAIPLKVNNYTNYPIWPQPHAAI
jgi:NAD(P)-dependent dehydrogenase (short-subunit alcohol dehydrogenase family)